MIQVRQATQADLPFLARIILLAETSGHELIGYRDMFAVPEADLLQGFEAALDNEQEGHGLTYRSFWIAEVDGQPAAAAAGYVEGVQGSSAHLMTGALMTGFGMELVMQAFAKNAAVKTVNIVKTVGALQIDSVATLEEYRGKGLFKAIFDRLCNMAALNGADTLEIQVWAGNLPAIAAYTKVGCSISIEKQIDPLNKNAGGRILMSKKIR